MVILRNQQGIKQSKYLTKKKKITNRETYKEKEETK